MNYSRIRRGLMLVIAIISAATLTGCAGLLPGQSSDMAEIQNTVDIDMELPVSVDKDDIVDLKQSSEIISDEAIAESKPIEESEEIEEEVEVANEWIIAKTSGEEVDFKKYFNIDASRYKAVAYDRGTVEQLSYYSSYLDNDNEVYIYTPPEYDTDIEYPVIYVLHGLGCDGEQWISMGAARMLDNLINTGKIEPVIAVFPSIVPKNGLTEEWLSDENIGAFTSFNSVFTRDLRPYVNYYYSVSTDRDKTAVCGLSMGGMQALKLGFSMLDQFDYIGSFSAAPTLDMEILNVPDGIEAPKLVLLCSGDSDDVVGDNPKSYHEKLDENGIDHIWYQHPGAGHTSNVWEKAFVNFITRAFEKEEIEDIVEDVGEDVSE